MHAHPAPRGGPCARQRFSAALQTPLDPHLRIVRAKVSAVLQTKAEQPSLRLEPGRLVCPGAPGGRLCRDLRRLAPAAFELAASLPRLARAAQTRIRRRADWR